MSDPLQSGSGLPRLIVTGGSLDGTVLAVDRTEKRLGTEEGSDIRVQAGHIEPLHALVRWDGRSLLVSDAGSVSGTYVNGEKIGTDHPLQDGDRVCLGPPGFKGSVKMIVSLPAAMPDSEIALDDAIDISPASGAEPLLLDPAAFASPAGGEPFSLDQPSSSFLDPGSSDAVAVPDEGTPFTLESPTGEEDWTRAAAAAADAPEPEPPPPAARPAPAPPPRAAKAAKPDYSSDVPSMMSGGDRVRESIDLPPRDEPAAPAKGRVRTGRNRAAPSAGLKRTLLINGGVAVAAIVALVAYRSVHRPSPVLTGVSAKQVRPGESLTLSGRNFGASAEGNTVRFGDVPAQVSAASETSLTVTVPIELARAKAADAAVTVEHDGRRSGEVRVAVVQGPRVESVEPEVAMPGSEVTLRGGNLKGEPLTVQVGDMQAKVSSADGAVVRVIVPALVPATEGRSVSIVVQAGSERSAPVTLVLGQLPLVTEAVPSGGQIGDRVVLRGKGFDPAAGGNLVSFDGVPALVLAATKTELAVVVPAPTTRGSQVDESVIVETHGSKSSGSLIYKLQAISSSSFTPRYYAAPALEHPGHDHAFVSTDLGPVLLLTGRADASSTGTRAVKVASTLNALVQSAMNEPLTLEVRDAPQPSVGVVGRPDVVVTATTEDVAGYAESWDGSKPARLTPKGVAAHWAALLQDHLTLFVSHQRPTRSVEVSPKGKAFLDLYSEAARRGDPASGIPIALALSPAFMKAHRELALQLPGGGQGAAAAVIAGRWAGSMNDGGGAKTIQVDFTVEGNRIAGSMSTASGAVTLSMPLQDVAYEKQQLRFVTYTGKVARHFAGRVDGRAIEGTIQGAPGTAPGVFSLRFIE